MAINLDLKQKSYAVININRFKLRLTQFGENTGPYSVLTFSELSNFIQ